MPSKKAKSLSSHLVSARSNRSVRFLLSNPWRTLVLAAFVVAVSYGGVHVYQYTQAATLEDLAKADCGAVGEEVGPATARCIAQKVMIPYEGWSSGQWKYLDDLWTRESGFQVNIWNTAGSGAYGIPQSLPATKMASVYCVHPVQSKPANRFWHNATCQEHWGVQYIKAVYGNPENAWAFELAHNGY
jgi:hypothetical protein